jgi:hypothetical protein
MNESLPGVDPKANRIRDEKNGHTQVLSFVSRTIAYERT